MRHHTRHPDDRQRGRELDQDRGLQFDLGTMFTRRRLLGLFGGAGVAALAACSSDSVVTPPTAASTSSGGGSSAASTSVAGSVSTSAAPPTTTAATVATDATGATTGTTTDTTSGTPTVTEVVPEETGGPFPGDGSNGPNVLTQSGVVRSDIRNSFGELSGSSSGVPLTLTMTILDSSNDFAPLAGGAVYIWHADQDGRYSLYSDGATDQNYLRGVQEADANGWLTFVTNFPSCYSGRWPHIHFEVYPSLAAATSAGTLLRTSQMALPEDVCTTVFATDAYSTSARNMSGVSLESDNVFRDGWELEMLAVTGDVTTGYVADYTCAV